MNLNIDVIDKTLIIHNIYILYKIYVCKDDVKLITKIL